MRYSSNQLLSLAESFFRNYLTRVCGASHHTVVSYRDTLKIYFSFLSDNSKHSVDSLCVEDLTIESVLEFLDHLERKRKNSVATRNHRLTVIRSFFRHLIREDPTHAGQYYRILSIPSKKTRTPIVCYLEPEEVQVVLLQPDLRKPREAHDFALMIFLYNTGSRISEALAACWSDIYLTRPRHVHLQGKGRKNRIVPLWAETTKALKRVLVKQNTSPKTFVFSNARGEPLTRDGAAYLLRKYLNRAAKQHPVLQKKHVTPHVFRHSCAVALLQSGVDISVIRDYLGHESIATTTLYTKTNLQMKRRVLNEFWKHAGLTKNNDPRWKPTPKVLDFLSSL